MVLDHNGAGAQIAVNAVQLGPALINFGCRGAEVGEDS